MQEQKHISILGAGLVGSLWSVFLAQKGHKLDVYEKRPDMRKNSIDGGKSINLALSMRGWKALDTVGLAEPCRKIAIPMHGRLMHSIDSKLTFQPYGKEGQSIFSISRAELNSLLMNKAEALGVNIHFDHSCDRIDINKSKNKLFFQSGSQVETDILFGTDGAFSALRHAMQMTDRFNYEQYYIAHGYKELTIPRTQNGDFALESNVLHIWPRKNFMLIALPNLDKSFTCTLFLPFEDNINSFENLQDETSVKTFFDTQFPDVVKHMPTLIEDFFANPTASLVTIHCYPWAKNNTLLLGDAAHAIVPFYGQGMNAGFEDCSLLNDMMTSFQGNWTNLFKTFQQQRKKDADAISHLALQNFIEMRDRVADADFLLQKKIEARLHELYPNQWIPQYSRVTFSHEPYAKALAIGQKQEQIMQEILQTENIKNQWQDMHFETFLEKLHS